MQALYQYEIQHCNEDAILEYTINKDNYIVSTQEFATEIFRGVLQHQTYIDTLITEHSIDWKIDRLAIIDKAILRLSIWELLFTDTSVKIIIAESIDLIRKYSVDEAIKFVNGLLGRIASSREEYQKELTGCLPV